MNNEALFQKLKSAIELQRMSANGLDLPTIAKITQLPEEEVRALLE